MGAFYGDKCIQGLAVKCAFFISDKIISFNHNLAYSCRLTEKDNIRQRYQDRYITVFKARLSTWVICVIKAKKAHHVLSNIKITE